MKPKITVYTSCYNQGEYLERAIVSVLHQSVQPYEYILINDGSTDNTKEVMDKWSRKIGFIRAFSLEKQPTTAHVHNYSINRMQGNIWCWMPADDLFRPDLLEKKLKLFNSGMDKAVIYSSGDTINEKGIVTGEWGMENCSPEDFAMKQYNKCFTGCTGLWVPKELFDVQLFPTHAHPCEDYWWTLYMSFKGYKFIKIQDKLYNKRIHSNRVNARLPKEIQERVVVIKQEMKEKFL